VGRLDLEIAFHALPLLLAPPPAPVPGEGGEVADELRRVVEEEDPASRGEASAADLDQHLLALLVRQALDVEDGHALGARADDDDGIHGVSLAVMRAHACARIYVCV
jgi:hypothetical protein